MRIINFEDFIKEFNPLKNPFNPKAECKGFLFKAIEFSRIVTNTIQDRLLWTVLEESEYDPINGIYNNILIAYPGQMTGGVKGYFVTNIPYEYGDNILIKVNDSV